MLLRRPNPRWLLHPILNAGCWRRCSLKYDTFEPVPTNQRCGRLVTSPKGLKEGDVRHLMYAVNHRCDWFITIAVSTGDEGTGTEADAKTKYGKGKAAEAVVAWNQLTFSVPGFDNDGRDDDEIGPPDRATWCLLFAKVGEEISELEGLAALARDRRGARRPSATRSSSAAEFDAGAAVTGATLLAELRRRGDWAAGVMPALQRQVAVKVLRQREGAGVRRRQAHRGRWCELVSIRDYRGEDTPVMSARGNKNRRPPGYIA